MRNTRLEVDIDQFYENVSLISSWCGKEILPVIKANAYGTYLNHRLDVLSSFSIVAVALVEEGVFLRQLGYQGVIFILNQPSVDEISTIQEYSLSVGLCDFSFLEECIKRDSSFPVHIEVETGMNRTGVSLSNFSSFLDFIQKSSLLLEGIYSHFSSADTDSSYSKKQISIFQEALEIASSKGISFRYIHMSASNGILNYPLPFTNLVRPGILLYGYEPYFQASSKIPVKPICRLVSQITFLKTVSKGEKIGYGQSYTCLKDSTIATIPIGYGDGYRRELSNRGEVAICGVLCPIVGNVCMDSIMVDVSGVNCHVGDDVILMDSSLIPLEKIASICHTIGYEILCTIGSRVPRFFIGGGEDGKRS